MKRKHIYSLLIAPVLVALICLACAPSSMRATFISEFKHRTATMFGRAPLPVTGADGKQGLRLESPEEYGLPTKDVGDQPGTEADKAEDVKIVDQSSP